MILSLIKTGLCGVLELPGVKKLAGGAVGKAAGILREHFLDSSHELGTAAQKSYEYGMLAISAGLADREVGDRILGKLAAGVKEALQSKVSREFSAQIREKYLLPYTQDRGWNEARTAGFGREVLDCCKSLAKQSGNILPTEALPEGMWAEMLNQSQAGGLSEMLLQRSQSVSAVSAEVAAFLRRGELLGNAVLFFFMEQVRKLPRTEASLSALQQQGMWADLRDLASSQKQMQASLQWQLQQLEAAIVQQQQAANAALQSGDFGQVAMLGQRLHELQSEQEARRQVLAQLPQMLREARESLQEVLGGVLRFEAECGAWCRAISGQIDDVRNMLEGIGADVRKAWAAAENAAEQAGLAHGAVEAVGEDVDLLLGHAAEQSHLLRELVAMMRNLQVSARIKPRDELSVYNAEHRRVLEQMHLELERWPVERREFSSAAILVGSALSSAGNLVQSVRVLERARDAAQTPLERGMAHYNLFQVHLRQCEYDAALEHLQAAMACDGKRYALHNNIKYPVEQILGAGGMGCAFLCSDYLRGKVVVKVFWEARKGPIKEVFSEVITMSSIAGKYVPTPIDYDYVDEQKQDRPFIVMEYVEGSMDGEAYLQKHGKMELVSGLEVGLQVAKGLEIAHAKGICHLDLKPANLLLRQANGQWEVKIIDFGLSRVVTSLKNEAMAKSRSGKSMLMQEVFGTLDYAPPEQLGDIRHGRPGPHSDIFSFGATLYRLLSGENPRTINPLCLPNNPQLFQLLAQCLMADPSRRPSSAIELVERLEQIDPQVFDSFAMGTIDTSGGYKPAPVSSASVSSGGHVLQNWKKQREASFRSLFIQAQELIHSDANQAMEKWSEAREFAPELCDQEFGDWEIYIKEQIKVQQKAAKRREQFEQLYTTAQELVQNNPLKTLEKLEEARQFAADLCDESFQQLVNFAKEEQQRHRQFKQLCTSAKDLVKSNPMEALDKLVKAEKLAPHLCDKEFGKWVNEATQEQQRHQKFKQLYASARNLVKSNPAEALEKLTEAEKLAPNLCDKGFHQLKSDVIQKQQRRVTFGQLFDDAKKLALHNPQEAIVKLKKAQQIEQDLCNERFQDLVNYAVEKQRRLQFDALCSEAQDMASSDLSAAWKKLSEAKEFAPDLCNESFERWVQYVSEKYRHSQFNLAYREAQELSKSDPQSAQQKLLKLQQAAPDLCNEDFHKWVAYAENAANKGTRSVFGKIASVFSSIPQPKYAEIDARPIPSRFMSDAPSAPLWLKEEWQERMEFLRRIIDLYRPMWLPEHVARNESLDAVPGPRSGGSLVQLSDLPSGLRRKVILARDGSPLLEMVEIPAGKFLMGSDKPQREVYLHAYWIARTPVTNRMWQKFLQESGYQPPRDDHDGDYLKHWSGNKPPADKLDHPVVNVSYIAVWAFCDYYGLMLPSEAQWEKAARGVDGRIYPWGDQQPTPKLCNFSGSEIRDTTPVGKYPDGISPFGLVDCAGNVWEWCADEYSSNLLQELDPNSGRVIRFCNNRANSRLALRGGSFSHGTEAVRCAYRRSFTAGYCDNYIGFRPSQDEAL